MADRPLDSAIAHDSHLEHWPQKPAVTYSGAGKFVRVAPGLYVGDDRAAYEALREATRLVTHVLSVRNGHPLQLCVAGERQHECTADNGTQSMWISVDDTLEEDLVGSGKLATAVGWLRGALFEHGGTVLVNCAFGVSRSGAVLAAALLVDMTDWRLVARHLGRVNSNCMPNDNFLGQLMWLGARLQQLQHAVAPLPAPSQHGAHYRCARCKGRLFADAHLAVHWRRGGGTASGATVDVCARLWTAGQQHDDGADSLQPDAPDSTDAATVDSTCAMDDERRRAVESERMAAFRLAVDAQHYVQHGAGVAAPDGSRPCGPKYLLKDAPDWLEPTGVVSDKIVCPFNSRSGARCGAKLGKFDWSGRQCKMDGCTARIGPWFHISPDKVDRIADAL